MAIFLDIVHIDKQSYANL